MPQKLRLTFQEFRNSQLTQKKIMTDNFMVLVKRQPGKGNRFFITVPKSLDKRSVKRHQTRRAIEGIILKQKNRLTLTGQIMIRPRKIYHEKEKTVWRQDLEQILQHEKNPTNSA